jgi:hypothetical protein
MTFDYGVDPSEMKGHAGSAFKLWPTEGEVTGLVDADNIPYVVGYTSTELEYLKFKSSGEPFQSEVWKDKCDHASYLLNSWLEAASCDSAMLYLTDGKNNFRNQIATLKTYKGQRKEEKPPFFYEIKSWVNEKYNSLMSAGCEADDDISKEAWRRHKLFADENGYDMLWTPEHRRFSGFVIISKDKDLNIIPGNHLEPGDSAKDMLWVDPLGWLDPKWKETEVNAYEFWPLFDHKPVNPKHLFTLTSHYGKIKPIPYQDIKEDDNGWEKKYVWATIDARGLMHQQDCVTRGPKKGQGKYRRFTVGKKKSNVLDKLKGAGLHFFYAQLITGDTVDNYPGLPGYGPKKAFDILEGSSSEQELFDRVLGAYIEYYRKPDKAREMMLEQGRLAWMQTKEGELWNLPKDGNSFPL